MKNKILKFFIIMLLAIPCTILFAACKDDSEVNEGEIGSKVASISVELVTDEYVDYVADTNTIRFEYGEVISFEKSEFKVTAKFNDDSTKEVSDYVVDLSSVENTPNVGIYEISFTYAEKTSKINVEIYPKKISKPTMKEGQILIFLEDTIVDKKISRTPETTFDEDTMMLVDGSVMVAEDAGNYEFKIVPDSNHIWDSFEDNEREEVVFEWKIDKAIMYSSDIETLLFEYEEGVERTISFDLSREQFFPFDEFFEITGTTSATEVGKYSFVMKLKPEKIMNYEIVDIYREEGIDFQYNADKTAITYFWEIVEVNA